MNPVLESSLTSIILVLGAGAMGAIGVTTAQGQASVAQAIVGVISLAVTAITAWWKARQRTTAATVAAVEKIKPEVVAAAVAKADPKAVIALVNDQPNGLKVVASSGPGIVERAPLK